jgi:hypothetical protein
MGNVPFSNNATFSVSIPNPRDLEKWAQREGAQIHV